jgi:DNA repair ATPase RecN
MLVKTQTPERRRYQRQVERLLDQIQHQTQELRRIKTIDAASRTLSDRMHRPEQTREQLANLVTARTPTGPSALTHP